MSSSGGVSGTPPAHDGEDGLRHRSVTSRRRPARPALSFSLQYDLL